MTANWNWTVNTDAYGNYAIDQAQLAVLMDIRGELKRLNRLLDCPNFLGMPRDLQMVVRNTAKRKRRA